ncbi:hypothetical protein Q8A73_001367 [Channa argus]|nr:hypothetical protein Q8A73_001367 [Channa argus]
MEPGGAWGWGGINQAERGANQRRSCCCCCAEDYYILTRRDGQTGIRSTDELCPSKLTGHSNRRGHDLCQQDAEETRIPSKKLSHDFKLSGGNLRPGIPSNETAGEEDEHRGHQQPPCVVQKKNEVDGEEEEGYQHDRETLSCSFDTLQSRPGTKKRSRAAFSHAQVYELERRFSAQRYLSVGNNCQNRDKWSPQAAGEAEHTVPLLALSTADKEIREFTMWLEI